MTRRAHIRKTPQTTINISEQAYEFIERYSGGRLREPKYQTVDRLIKEFTSHKNNSNEEIEGLKESVQVLRFEVRELKDGLVSARHRIRDYELKLGIITKDDMVLQEKNERDVLIK
jgi:hypothetical protein